MQSITPISLMGSTGQNVHLLARVYRTLGAWQWTLSPGLDDDSIQGACFLSPLISARNFEFFLSYFFYSFFFPFVQRFFYHSGMPPSMQQNGEKHGTHGLCSIQE
jgi:hypothetical protein